ncbi:MAG: 6-phosphogluconolactonase [Candidatus Marinimicrobia bacterium]|nr:6-phosphogluconolactonase [Candidatus Neomarinimicrobiota bacterium]MCF7829314.1 6-phosphogluconolactonase [Candidatus Neomarinimicrobiota bacterium]MCF7880024.1 6-phosphogluconolactonase [Candidatus Neomarinimicrobiota bacterium]
MKVFRNREAMNQALARDIAGQMQKKTKFGADFHLVLTGGSTPKPLYRLLGSEYSDKINWRHIHLYWGDERYVPHDHSDSNYRMAKVALLNHIEIPDANVHPMPTGYDRPEIAAETHSDELRRIFPEFSNAIPRFDLVLLGMGSDGHIASLFPNHDLLEEEETLVGVVTDSPKPPPTRLTLTLPVINAAKNIYFLVAGENKAHAVNEVLEGTSQSKEFPASLVNPEKGETAWWLDEAAAKLLE